MDGEAYMKWDCEQNENHPNWHTPYEDMTEEVIKYTEINIEEMDKIATLMTPEEIKSFVKADYSYIL